MYILKKLFIICYYRNRGCGVGLHSKLFIGFVLLACIVEPGYVHTICFPEFLSLAMPLCIHISYRFDVLQVVFLLSRIMVFFFKQDTFTYALSLSWLCIVFD